MNNNEAESNNEVESSLFTLTLPIIAVLAIAGLAYTISENNHLKTVVQELNMKYTDETARLKQLLQEEKQRSIEAAGQASRLQQLVDSLQAEVEKLRGEVETLKTETQYLNGQVSSREAVIRDLREELNRRIAEVQALKQENTQLKKNCGNHR